MKRFHGDKTLEEHCKELDHDGLVKLLNIALSGYFQSLTVNAKIGGQTEEAVPKRNTAESQKSHLKQIIRKEADLDISSNEFSKFDVSFY